MNFKIYRINVKSTVLNSFIQKEVNVEQAQGFESHEFSKHVFKLTNALYELKQTFRVWYERLNSFLLENEFSKGKVETTVFIKKFNNDLFIVQIYIDDIIRCY